MRDKYKQLLASAQMQAEIAQQFQSLCALVRSVTQTASVVAIELYYDFASTDEGLDLNGLLRRLHHPSDGDAITILDELIPRIRSSFWPSFATGWFEPYNGKRGSSEKPLCSELQNWVTFRNDRPAHGVMDRSLTADWAKRMGEIAEHAIRVLADAMPRGFGKESLFIQAPSGQVPLRTPLAFGASPVVIREFRNKRGLWTINVQTLDWESSVSARLEVQEGAPTISFLPEVHGRFHTRDVLVKGRQTAIFANVPTRQSSVFEGRRTEQQELIDWLADRESRACLVYGDGGVGKTTLVLEVINNLLDDEFEIEDYPTVVSYYSAKLTRWTANGIIHFKSVSTAVEDSVRELLLVFEDSLSKEWYRVEGRSLVDRVAAALRDAGLERDDVLLVLDNTETMARKLGEQEDLAKLISQISRKVARVLMTSRRREKVEARQIELLPMPEGDALALLRKLGEEYSADAIVKAGDARLRRIVRNLGCKPLLIDIMARHVGATRGSLDDAYATVMQESAEGLSEFLYEDAWTRMTESHRNVFLSLTCLDVPLNSRTVGWVCRELDVPHTEWLNSFYETHFGQITEYGSDYQMELDGFAEDFFSLKLKSMGEKEAERIRKVAQRVEGLSIKAEKAHQEYTWDRVEGAFRTPSARAAKMAAVRGDIQEAIDWYGEALREDPHNSQLYDRYAWFMMVKAGKLDEAIRLSSRAIDIDSDNADAHLTKGLALYRQGRVAEGDRHIEHAVRLGKPEALGLLRKGIARYYLAIGADQVEKKVALLNECLKLLSNATTKSVRNNPYAERNARDIGKYERKANSELKRLRRMIVSEGSNRPRIGSSQ